MNKLGLREFHSFQAGEKDFVYLVPSAAVFALDEAASVILHRLGESPMTQPELVQDLADRFPGPELEETIAELKQVQAIADFEVPEEPVFKILPPTPFPLSTMVLNVTNQCNLSCSYCYEYGEDKIVDTTNGMKAKFMTEETARQSVEFIRST